MRNEEEHLEQVALFDWAALQYGVYPELEMMFAVPNGGDRHPAVAAKLKAEGVKKGVLDVWLPVARKGFTGLVIEMKKRKGGRVSKEQSWWIDQLTKENHLVVVCAGWDAARDTLVSYLGEGK